MVTKKTKIIDNSDMKKYSKLLGTADYDHEAAEQLAEALNEIDTLEQRTAQLRQVVEENKELYQFVWRSAGSKMLALHDIDDTHLENIMMYILRSRNAIPRSIRGEAMRRNLTIPARVPVNWDGDDEPRLIEREIW